MSNISNKWKNTIRYIPVLIGNTKYLGRFDYGSNKQLSISDEEANRICIRINQEIETEYKL